MKIPKGNSPKYKPVKIPKIIRQIKSSDSMPSIIENDLKLNDSIATIVSATSDCSLQSHMSHSLSKISLRSQSFDLSNTEENSFILHWQFENNESKVVMQDAKGEFVTIQCDPQKKMSADNYFSLFEDIVNDC